MDRRLLNSTYTSCTFGICFDLSFQSSKCKQSTRRTLTTAATRGMPPFAPHQYSLVHWIPPISLATYQSISLQSTLLFLCQSLKNSAFHSVFGATRLFRDQSRHGCPWQCSTLTLTLSSQVCCDIVNNQVMIVSRLSISA